jgi:hypothetical protein
VFVYCDMAFDYRAYPGLDLVCGDGAGIVRGGGVEGDYEV